MRPVAIGRRNWTHIGHEKAGPRVAASSPSLKPAADSRSRSVTTSPLSCQGSPTYPSRDFHNSLPPHGPLTIYNCQCFDFLTLASSYKERELERGLLIHLRALLLEGVHYCSAGSNNSIVFASEGGHCRDF